MAIIVLIVGNDKASIKTYASFFNKRDFSFLLRTPVVKRSRTPSLTSRMPSFVDVNLTAAQLQSAGQKTAFRFLGAARADRYAAIPKLMASIPHAGSCHQAGQRQETCGACQDGDR